MGQHEIDREKWTLSPRKTGQKEYVSINDYFSLDIRVGRIIDVEQFPRNENPSLQDKSRFRTNNWRTFSILHRLQIIQEVS